MKPDHFKRTARQIRILCLVALTIFISGNQVSAHTFTEPQAGWTLLAEKGGVAISYRLASCNGGQRILFQIKNNTAADLPVDFECKITTDGKDITIPSLKNTVGANSTVVGSCADNPSQSAFVALPKEVTIEKILITIK